MRKPWTWQRNAAETFSAEGTEGCLDAFLKAMSPPVAGLQARGKCRANRPLGTRSERSSASTHVTGEHHARERQSESDSAVTSFSYIIFSFGNISCKHIDELKARERGRPMPHEIPKDGVDKGRLLFGSGSRNVRPLSQGCVTQWKSDNRLESRDHAAGHRWSPSVSTCRERKTVHSHAQRLVRHTHVRCTRIKLATEAYQHASLTSINTTWRKREGARSKRRNLEPAARSPALARN